jgi:hypothetical protein
VVAPKGDKAFPTGTALNVLKWRWQTSDEGALPLTVSCWPTPGGDGTTAVTLEVLHTCTHTHTLAAFY